MTTVSLAAACNGTQQGPAVSTVAGGIPPFDSLQTVHIGMSVGALESSRRTVPAPYVGLEEQIADGRLEYMFGHEAPGEGSPRGKLSSVTARYAFSDAETARVRAMAMLEAAETRLGSPTACEHRVVGTTRSVRAGWFRSDGLFEVVSVLDSGTTPPRNALIAAVRDDSSQWVPVASQARSSDCVALFRTGP